MTCLRLPRHALALCLTAAALLTSLSAQADRVANIPMLPQYQTECSACHLAYAPGMLPKASWERITANLGKHYGVDASVDAATTRSINTWLQANAGTFKRVGTEPPPDDRITRSAWFQRKHDEVPTTAWKRPAVKSPANCSACHPQADKGDFNEHAVRIPQ